MGLLPIPAPRLTQGASRAGLCKTNMVYTCLKCAPSSTAFAVTPNGT